MQNWHIHARGYSPTPILGSRVREIYTFVLILTAIQLFMNFGAYSSQLRAQFFDFSTDISQTQNIVALHKNIFTSGENGKANNQNLLAPTILPNETRLWVPKLNIDVPVLTAGDTALRAGKFKQFERDIQDLLKNGVVELPGSRLDGRTSITGHSSFYPWDDGNYKDIFATIGRLVRGDEIILFTDGKKLTYKVTEFYKVWPSEVGILNSDGDRKQISLITCTPIGTNLQRYIVIADLVE